MSQCIAKFRVQTVDRVPEDTSVPATMVTVEMAPVVAKPFDKDGKSEDNDFARWTPSGGLRMAITNPNLFDMFKVGDDYYLRFEKAESIGVPV